MVQSGPAKNWDQANKPGIKTLPAYQLINQPGVGVLTMMSKQRCGPGQEALSTTGKHPTERLFHCNLTVDSRLSYPRRNLRKLTRRAVPASPSMPNWHICCIVTNRLIAFIVDVTVLTTNPVEYPL